MCTSNVVFQKFNTAALLVLLRRIRIFRALAAVWTASKLEFPIVLWFIPLVSAKEGQEVERYKLFTSFTKISNHATLENYC